MMIQNTFYRLGGLLLLMIVSAVQAESIPNPCKILTLQEVENIMHIPMKPGKLKDHRSTFQGMSCWYLSVDRFEKTGSIDIGIDTTQSMKETDSIYESAKDEYDRKKYAHIEALKYHHKENAFHPIKDMGDDAFWYDPSLTILDKDAIIIIRVHAGAGLSAHGSEELRKKVEAADLSVATNIAKLLLKRIESK